MSEKLHNINTLAAALGVPRSFITAAKKHGFLMPGGRATEKQFLDWHKKAEDFKITTPRPNASSRAASASDKPRAPRLKRAPHTASSAPR